MTSVLINGMSNFEAGAATAATVASVELDAQYKRQCVRKNLLARVLE